MRFMDPETVAVAPLLQTVYLRERETIICKRMQPLYVPAGTTVIAVTRIEVDRTKGAKMTDEQMAKLSSAIISSCGSAVGVQIDFDAKVSERDFYKRLLCAVRAQLPAGKSLSMTSLASWAFFDDWLSGNGCVNEFVPMFFSMGNGKKEILDLLKSDADMRKPFGQALGVSMYDEEACRAVIDWAAKHRPDARIYVFNAHPWTKRTVLKSEVLTKDLFGASKKR